MKGSGMRAHWNTWGRVSQVQKLGYRKYVMVHAWQGTGNGLGMLADVQVSPHKLTAHVWRLFPPECRSRWQWCHLMMSLTFFLHRSRVGIRGSAHKTQVHSFFSFGSWSFWLIPQLVCPGSHRPSNLATLVPLNEWNYNQTWKCSLFVQL